MASGVARMTVRALLGVVHARLYVQRRIVYYSCAAAFVVGLAQPAGSAAPLFLFSLLGVAMALAQSPGLNPHLDRCEQSAPLFGRELARAKALVPCVAASLGVAVFACAQIVRGASAPLDLFIALAAVIATTLTALSATMRRRAARLLYVGLAAATSVVAYALVAAAHSVASELAFCSVVAFFALRQYGETLARYDPI
jgi:hypothetical protein